MTGAQLKHIRLSRGWKLRDMAAALKDVSHTTIMRWEDDCPSDPVPSWVTERLFRTMPVTLPLEDLQALLEMAREEKLPFEQILSGALRAYLEQKATQPDNVTPLYPDGSEDTAQRIAEGSQPPVVVQFESGRVQ